MIILKTADEIASMQRAGQIVAEALWRAGAAVCSGLRTVEIDNIVAACFASHGAAPLLPGSPGPPLFRASASVCVNDEVGHGIPGERRLATGDVVSVDTACRFDGWCADAAWTWIVGEGTAEARGLVTAGRQVLERAVAACRTGILWSGVADEIEASIRERGCSLVEAGVGHGIGRELHEDPQVPNRATEARRSGLRLETGLTLAIEPTLTTGSGQVRRATNGLTLVTADRRPAVHFEHTVAITANGPLVLTAGIES